MASRLFKATWAGVYRANMNDYYSNYVLTSTPLMTAGDGDFHSYVGFNAAQIAEAIETSKEPCKIFLRLNVMSAGQFDIGLHKQRRNTKADEKPGFRDTGLRYSLGNRYHSIDITNFPKELPGYPGVKSFREALEQGFQGIVLFAAENMNYGEASGYTNASSHITLEVQGLWNTKPGKPTITYPKSGVTINEKTTLRGTPARDSEQAASTLRYQWAIYDGSWNYLSLTSEGEINRNVDFINYKETSAAKVRVRAYDGELYGDWVESEVFTINHNKAPAVPSSMSPRGGDYHDRTQDITFSWQHNDQDGQSAFTLRWRKKGEAAWTTITRNTVNSYYIAPANTFPVGEIEWQVRTMDQGGLVSPFSSTVIFYAAEATDAPNILWPGQNESISEPTPTITWSSVNQDHFQLEILSGGNVIWSVEDNSEVKGYTVGEPLANDTDYIIRLRVRMESGLWSAWDEKNVHTSFTPPNQPEIRLLVHEEEAAIEIAIVNPPQEGDTPETIHNEIYRRIHGSGEDYIKINAYSEPDEYWIDFTPGTGVIYEYMVRAWGVNGAFMDSVPALGTVDFNKTILMLVSDPSKRVNLLYNPSRSLNKSVSRNMMNFNGRAYPVAEFGVLMNAAIDLSFDLRDKEDLEILYDLLEARETLLYRDGRGRREFVTIDSLDVTDKMPHGYTVGFTTNRVDFVEGIE